MPAILTSAEDLRAAVESPTPAKVDFLRPPPADLQATFLRAELESGREAGAGFVLPKDFVAIALPGPPGPLLDTAPPLSDLPSTLLQAPGTLLEPPPPLDFLAEGNPRMKPVKVFQLLCCKKDLIFGLLVPTPKFFFRFIVQ